ncbi:probable receptor-like protein kinase At5g61350 [Cynara cardunculus var. scolymus]|uniref:Concanavalin A-like lectin/glucanase, subgroup n=1 Tax=Cynara cardunculus var. scolymus TaxID=59895 RepID=A0A118K3S4_CYNCS|nr:probable receptor-like protein kinase At5g61350 [Cynara cardunculus var. scolymus]KVI06436.1 Concanavalin A-like lectin/glucanase, subgroup [Cynara cardunculus var. scolymus]
MGGSKLSFTVLCIMFYSLSTNARFTPPENYLIDCGSPENTILDDGRTFKSDPQSVSFLSTDENIFATSISAPPLYRTARIFNTESVYKFLVFQPGRHFLRLYFFPLHHPSYNLTTAVFTVKTDGLVLLHDFSATNNSDSHFKEYLINVTSDYFSLVFSPLKKSFAFINAIEFVSAPNELVSDSATTVSPAGVFNGVSGYDFQVLHRVNVGGPTISPKNDTLSRTWMSDSDEYMMFPKGEKVVSVDPSTINYPDGGATSLIAPNQLYSSAASMADSGVSNSNFNLTWEMKVDPGFNYLIRLHFCDIVSSGLNTLYFNVYINGFIGVSELDLSSLTSDLAIVYYKDFMINALAISNGLIRVQVGPSDLETSAPNAILNGLEIMKMKNTAGSLDGLFSSGSNSRGSRTTTIAEATGVAIGVIMLLVLVVSLIRRKNRARDWDEGGNSFTSWFLPLNASYCSSLLSSKSKNKNGYSSVFPSKIGLGRSFAFSELRDATKNFDESEVIGVGGFGKVYIGEIEKGTKLAIKRGNPRSSQGINEFQTEIQLLSKLRHRHLVSLIGYCDENTEMILVYEFMANGPLRDHLYGSTLPSLTWRQRLEISIGAARGLHYLHTGGSSQGIIHRDVKTTNILLDENLVAKVSDFGLSKTGPALDQTHVSTAVKGSFGYLDPEYFRRQQLTEKSDVYSFGVVLFEILCARPALDPALPREQVNLAEWAMQKQRKGGIEMIVDPKIVKTISSESLIKYVEAAEKCIAEYGVDRPSMGDVLWNLEFALQLQDASSQLDPPQEKEDGTCNVKKMKLIGSEESKNSDVSIVISDDSGVVMGSPLFSKIQDFEGR